MIIKIYHITIIDITRSQKITIDITQIIDNTLNPNLSFLILKYTEVD